MNLGLHVERVEGRHPPPPYSPDLSRTDSIVEDRIQNAIKATVVHQRRPLPKLLQRRRSQVPGAAETARAVLAVPHSCGAVPATERAPPRPDAACASLSWGPQASARPSLIPNRVITIISRPQSSRRSRVVKHAHSKPRPQPEPPGRLMKLPRTDSLQFRRKLTALINPQKLFDQARPAIRRRPLPDADYRDEVESLSTWWKQKLNAAGNDDFIVHVVATAIDDLIRQVSRHMAERGILLAELIDRDRRHRRAVAEQHEQSAVSNIQNLYRERIMALVESQRSELQRFNDERLEIWNECEEMRKHIVERDEMLSDLQHQMDDNVKHRDDIIQRQEQINLRLQCALDDLSVKFNEIQQQYATASASLNAASLTITDLRLDLQFAAERALLTSAQPSELAAVNEPTQEPGTSSVQDDDDREDLGDSAIRGSEAAQHAAIRIQSLIRGRRARRLTSDRGRIASNVSILSSASDDTDPSGEHFLAVLPAELRRLFHCQPETYQTYFQQNVPLPKFLRWLGDIVSSKSDYDVYSVQSATPRLTFAEMVYDYYLSQHSQRESVELDLLDLCHNLASYRSESARVRLFFKYLSEDARRITEAVLIAHEGLRFYACGPFESAADNSQGVCWIDVPASITFLKRLFRHLPEPDLNSALQTVQTRARTLSVARQFTGASRAAYKSIERFMDVDDCLEIIWDLVRVEDQRLTVSMTESFTKSLHGDRANSEDSVPTLSDFEVMLEAVDQGAVDSHLRVLQIYRNASKLATRRPILIADLVTASRNAGILPIRVNSDEFPRLTASRIHRIRAHSDEDAAQTTDPQHSLTSPGRSGLGDEQLAMMHRRLAAMREKVIDTANTWKAKLERMQEKYDGVSSKLRTEYETRLADLLSQERDHTEQRLNAQEKHHRAKLQLCFEKFEEHRGASDSLVDDLRSKLRTSQNELRRLASDSISEKQQLFEAVDSLSARLEEEVAKSRQVADDLAQRTTRFVEDLNQGAALMARELTEMTRMMERSQMGEEDCRARLLAQAVRQASEANMLRRGKLMRSESIRGDAPLVATLPPVSSLEFDSAMSKPHSPPSLTRQTTLASRQTSITLSRPTSLDPFKTDDTV